jgi:hypothetical protein
MRLIQAGEAVVGGTGTVLAVFRRAVYVSHPLGLVVLVEPDAEPGPLHAHVAFLPRVSVGADITVETHGAKVWRPGPLPPPGRIADMLRRVLDHEPDLDLVGTPGPVGTRSISALAGRGIGLTPAGDDVLAGLLLAARAGGAPEADLVTVARAARTHAISRAYLEQAARGRSIAALHDLMAACADADLAAARAARERLARVGHTSGLDLAYGVLLGSES